MRLSLALAFFASFALFAVNLSPSFKMRLKKEDPMSRLPGIVVLALTLFPAANAGGQNASPLGHRRAVVGVPWPV